MNIIISNTSSLVAYCFGQIRASRLVPSLFSLLGKWGSLNLLELSVPTTLIKSRLKAFKIQSGFCIYCEQPMWLTDIDTFAKTYQISIKQAKLFQCTAEHLLAKQDGGTNHECNIAAACNYCNQKRHKRKKPLAPILFKLYVMKRLAKGRWHSILINTYVHKSNQIFPVISFQSHIHLAIHTTSELEPPAALNSAHSRTP